MITAPRAGLYAREPITDEDHDNPKPEERAQAWAVIYPNLTAKYPASCSLVGVWPAMFNAPEPPKLKWGRR